MGVKEISTIVKTACSVVVATVAAVCLIVLTKNANQTMDSFRKDVSNIKNGVIDVKNDVHDMGDKFNKTFSEENRNRLSSILNKVDDQVLSGENIRKVENSLSTANNVASGARTVGNWFSFAWHMMAG